jgi:DNA replication protein DnaC
MNADSPTKPDAAPCPLCGGAGFIRLDVPLGHPQFGKAVACRCKRQAVRERKMSSLRRASNLDHLGKMSFATFQTERHGAPEVTQALQEALHTAQEFAAHPAGWLVFTGTYGCGKTHLAAAIANHCIEQGREVLFVVVPDLLDHLRATYAPDSPVSYDERFNQIRNIGLLMLDDLGIQNATPWAVEKLYQLLNYRYNADLPTVITTNQTLDDIDPRLASRFKDQDTVHIIPIYAPDYRTKGKEEAFGSLNLYHGMSFGSFADRHDELDPVLAKNLRHALRVVEEYATQPINWLLLRGGYGVGKTHLAAACAQRIFSSGIAVLFVVVPDLLDHLRATYQPGSAVSYDQRFNEVRRVPLLVLDDLGTQSATPWAQEKLFQILNYRYTAGLPTIITVSNDGWEQLPERLKNRLLDTRVCMLLDINVPSYRGASAETAKPRRTTRMR